MAPALHSARVLLVALSLVLTATVSIPLVTATLLRTPHAVIQPSAALIQTGENLEELPGICTITKCANGGTLDERLCQCSCKGHWGGDSCQSCRLTCKRGGKLDPKACTCDCPVEYDGEDCSACKPTGKDMSCHSGTWDSAVCSCECRSTDGFTGPNCSQCERKCVRGRLDEKSCTCVDCCAQEKNQDGCKWGGDFCDECTIKSCPNRQVLNNEKCRCDPAGGMLASLFGGGGGLVPAGGEEVSDATLCNKSCFNNGKLDITTCQCQCGDRWGGDFCQSCRLGCLHGGVLDAATCQCSCAMGRAGTSCEKCSSDGNSCKNGVWDPEACECSCKDGFSGPDCGTCDRACPRGVLDPAACVCRDCCAMEGGDGCAWGGTFCDTCELTKCDNGEAIDKGGCRCGNVSQLVKWKEEFSIVGAGAADPMDSNNAGPLVREALATDGMDGPPPANPFRGAGAVVTQGKDSVNATSGPAQKQGDSSSDHKRDHERMKGSKATPSALPGNQTIQPGDTPHQSHQAQILAVAPQATALRDPQEALDTLFSPILRPCNLACKNGGSLNEAKCTCSCVEPWGGDECESCRLNCGNQGALVEESCQCACKGPWGGRDCNTCVGAHDMRSKPVNKRCGRTGGWNEATCECDCLGYWEGVDCTVCSIPRCPRGRLSSAECICKDCCGPDSEDCDWTGDYCDECSITKCPEMHGLDATICKCVPIKEMMEEAIQKNPAGPAKQIADAIVAGKPTADAKPQQVSVHTAANTAADNVRAAAMVAGAATAASAGTPKVAAPGMTPPAGKPMDEKITGPAQSETKAPAQNDAGAAPKANVEPSAKNIKGIFSSWPSFGEKSRMLKLLELRDSSSGIPDPVDAALEQAKQHKLEDGVAQAVANAPGGRLEGVNAAVARGQVTAVPVARTAVPEAGVEAAVPLPNDSGKTMFPMCKQECGHGSKLDGARCKCSTCSGGWGGDSCQTCRLRCLHGGVVDPVSCTCQCPPNRAGPRCDKCKVTEVSSGCQNGTWNPLKCQCECNDGFEGPHCDVCSRKCVRGILDETKCICRHCCNLDEKAEQCDWGGVWCDQCLIFMCPNGRVIDKHNCKCVPKPESPATQVNVPTSLRADPKNIVVATPPAPPKKPCSLHCNSPQRGTLDKDACICKCHYQLIPSATCPHGGVYVGVNCEQTLCSREEDVDSLSGLITDPLRPAGPNQV